MRHKDDRISLIIVVNALPKLLREELVAGLSRMLKIRHIRHFAESDLHTLLLLAIIPDEIFGIFGIGLGQFNSAEDVMTSDAVVNEVQLVGLELLQYDCLPDEL